MFLYHRSFFIAWFGEMSALKKRSFYVMFVPRTHLLNEL